MITERNLPRSVTLIRHPRWAGNVEGATQSLLASPKDYELGPDETGVSQAIRLGQTALKERDIPDVVLASPYLRAREGARLGVAEAWPDRPIFVDIAHGLIEQDKGRDEGDYYEDDNLFDREYPEGESLRETVQRLQRVLEQPEYAGKDVVLFTHARMMLAAKLALGRQDYTSFRGEPP